ncbi:related to SGD1 - essential nuclear protein, required for biogenesis of the small ribosomal subunit [Ustilago trichophora]|uniref:Related to SGD1 - essential nuclear protein, required for biogenesis of the small ribosomal subunit n=1 Tax=Ustilago trichophora TaxID=86804 RepID=A0A5C3EKJ8_9BASI|nr:related to SGD1 - essential nuclear protein, required for biogenesis of the small ribosomal subunit [Ustilago trichophora]
MPFDQRFKSRKTTTLPAALRDELGLPAPSANKRSFRPHDRRFDSRNGAGKPQLKAIGRPQSSINGAVKGAARGPIKSLRNQEKEQQQLQQHARSKPGHVTSAHSNANANANANAKAKAGGSGSSSRTPSRSSTNANVNSSKDTQKRKPEKQPEQALKVIKKPKSSKPQQPAEDTVEHKTRLNPFTGEMEVVKSTIKKSSSKPTQTALQKMLARAEAGPSSSKGKAKASDGLGGGKKKSRRHMTQQEKEEEDEIRWLEYSLGKSRQGEDVVRDDLDDFLDDLDRFQVGMYDESESEDDDASEEEGESDDSGLEEVSASEEEEEGSEKSEESEDEDESEEQSDVEGASAFEDEEGMYDFDSNDEDDFSNWDAAMATTDEEDQAESDDDETDGESEEEDDSEAEEARMLISGTTTTTSAVTSSAPTASSSTPVATATTKYIPPALRAKLAAESSTPSSANHASSGPGVGELEMDPISAQKLRRQAQGLLNRLGDANIDTILSEYETLYRTHARAHVTSTITQLILDTITSRSNLIDTFVILHAALVAALQKVVGVEFAAFFIQRLVEELTQHYDALKKSSVEGGKRVEEEEEEEARGKECLNLTVLACELYNLHVVACPLIYDLIRMFLGQQVSSPNQESGNIGEVDIELLLKTIRSCGQQLRTDDPTSLKAIISLTQTRVSSSTTSSTTRTKFMLERMTDLEKSTKSSKLGANDPNNPSSPSFQLLTRMKKFLGGLAKKRTVKSHEALRIGLKDLRDADKKGKWWLVGAAWTGQTDQKDAQGLTKLLPMNARSDVIQSSSTTFEGREEVVEEDRQQKELLELAKLQGMNTDARRTVFITLLTAEDFKQAAENVLMLKLNDVQRREIVRVLVHCVGSEAVYNPYYTLIGQEICRNDHGMRITLQYCLWDFLREIGQKEVGGEKFAAALFTGGDEQGEAGKKVDARRIGNMARAYAWWITHDCLSLQALKTVDFTLLNPRPSQFLGLLLIHLILSIQSKSASKTLHLPTITKPIQQEKVVKFLQSNLLGGSVDLCRGLLFFLSTKLDTRAQKNLVLGEEKDKSVKNVMQPLLETVKQGLGLVLKTVQGIVQQHDGVGQGVEDGDLESDLEDDHDDVEDDY